MVTKGPLDPETENQIALVMAGHKMAGFNMTEVDRDALRAQWRGEIDIDEVVEEFKATNAAAKQRRDIG